jgi:hypothetical protein
VPAPAPHLVQIRAREDVNSGIDPVATEDALRLLRNAETTEVSPDRDCRIGRADSDDDDRSLARHERRVRVLQGEAEQSRYGGVAGARMNEAVRSEGTR